MRRGVLSLLAGCLLATAACGDDDGGPPVPSSDRLNLRLSSAMGSPGYELVDGDPAPV